MVGMAANHVIQNRVSIGLLLSKSVALNQPKLGLVNPLARSFASATAARAKVQPGCPFGYLGKLLGHGKVSGMVKTGRSGIT